MEQNKKICGLEKAKSGETIQLAAQDSKLLFFCGKTMVLNRKGKVSK